MELQRQASYLKHRERDLKRMEEQLRLKGEVLRAREAAQERIENRLKRDIVPSACLQHRCPTYSSLYSRQSVPVIYAPRITVQNNASHCNGAYGSYASSSTYERYGRSDQYDGGGYIELDEKTVYSQESGVQDGSPYCSGDEEAFYSQEPGIQNGSPYSSDDEEAVHSQKPSIIEEDQDIESSASSATGEAIGDVNEQDAGAESGYDAPFSSGSEQEYDGYSDGGGGYGDDYDDYDNEEDCWSDGS